MQFHADHLDISRDIGDVRYLFEVRAPKNGNVDITRIRAERDASGGGFDKVTTDRLVQVSTMLLRWTLSQQIERPLHIATAIDATPGALVALSTSEPVRLTLERAPAWLSLTPTGPTTAQPSLSGTPDAQAVSNISIVATGMRSKTTNRLDLTLDVADVRMV